MWIIHEKLWFSYDSHKIPHFRNARQYSLNKSPCLKQLQLYSLFYSIQAIDVKTRPTTSKIVRCKGTHLIVLNYSVWPFFWIQFMIESMQYASCFDIGISLKVMPEIELGEPRWVCGTAPPCGCRCILHAGTMFPVLWRPPATSALQSGD